MELTHLEIVLFFIVQSIIILGALITSYVKIQIAIAKLQTNVLHIHECTDQLKADHSRLRDKVNGISRSVAKLEAKGA